jgi:hypothetical protein
VTYAGTSYCGVSSEESIRNYSDPATARDVRTRFACVEPERDSSTSSAARSTRRDITSVVQRTCRTGSNGITPGPPAIHVSIGPGVWSCRLNSQTNRWLPALRSTSSQALAAPLPNGTSHQAYNPGTREESRMKEPSLVHFQSLAGGCSARTPVIPRRRFALARRTECLPPSHTVWPSFSKASSLHTRARLTAASRSLRVTTSDDVY